MVGISAKNVRTGTPNTASVLNYVEDEILDVQEFDGNLIRGQKDILWSVESKCLLIRFLYMKVTWLKKGREWKNEEGFRERQQFIMSPSAIDVTPLAGFHDSRQPVLLYFGLAAHVSVCQALGSFALCYAQWKARVIISWPAGVSASVSQYGCSKQQKMYR